MASALQGLLLLTSLGSSPGQRAHCLEREVRPWRVRGGRAGAGDSRGRPWALREPGETPSVHVPRVPGAGGQPTASVAAPGACSHSGRGPTPRAPTPRGRWTQEGALPARSGCCRGWSWKCPLSAMDRRIFKPCFITCLPAPRAARLRCRADCPSVLPPPPHRHGLKQPRVRHPTGCRRVDPLTSLGSGLFPGVSEKEAATVGVQVAPGSSGPLPPSLGNQLLGLRARDPAGPCPPCPRPQACVAPVGRSRPGLMWPQAALTSGFGTGQPQGLPGQRLPGLRFYLPTAYKAPWVAAAWSGDGCFITEFFPNKEPTDSAMPGGCQGWRLSTCLPPSC